MTMQSIVVVSSIKNILWLPLLIVCYISSSISKVEARALRGPIAETGGIFCTTAQQCKAKHDSMNNGGTFYSGNYPTKGCFSKITNNNVYFGTGGSIEDISTFDLQGVKQRIYCDVEPMPIEQVASPTNNNEEDDDNTVVCLTAEQCQAKLSSLNNGGTFYKSPKYNTKGCFSKTNVNHMFFGLGGSIDEMSTNNLPGKQERVRCDTPVSIEVVTDSPTTKPVTDSPTTDTPSVQPTNKPITMSPSMIPSNSPKTNHPSIQPTDMEEDLTDWSTYSPSLPPMEVTEDNEDVTVETTIDSLQWDLLEFADNTPDTTSRPTVKLTTASPTDMDTLEPSNSPSVKPTPNPTNTPSNRPSLSPTYSPTSKPTNEPSNQPSSEPSRRPISLEPSSNPTDNPTQRPSSSPSVKPSASPVTDMPSIGPSKSPNTDSPSLQPTDNPVVTSSSSDQPTPKLSIAPLNPTEVPTESPTRAPTSDPSQSPSKAPLNPTQVPTGSPSKEPSSSPTIGPSVPPTKKPTSTPSQSPSTSPSKEPSVSPSSSPSKMPSVEPTQSPSLSPSDKPITEAPTISPSVQPGTDTPSSSPSKSPVTQTPSLQPTSKPVTQTPSGSPIKSPVVGSELVTEVSDQIMTEVSIEDDDASDTDSVSTSDMDTALDIDSNKEIEVEEVKDESGERDVQDTQTPSQSPTIKDKCRRLKEKREKDRKKKEDSAKKQGMKKEQLEVEEEEEVEDEDCVETETNSIQDEESPIDSETSNTSVVEDEEVDSSPFDNEVEISSPEEGVGESDVPMYPLPISPFTLTLQTDNATQSNTIDNNELGSLVTNHLLKEIQLEPSSAELKMVSINVRPVPVISGLSFGSESLPNEYDYEFTGNAYFEDPDMPTSEALDNAVVQSFEGESAERLLTSLQSSEDDGLQSVKSISIDMSDQINTDMVSNRLDVNSGNDDPLVNDQLYIIAIIFGVACFTLIAIYAFNRTRRRQGDEHEVLEDEIDDEQSVHSDPIPVLPVYVKVDNDNDVGSKRKESIETTNEMQYNTASNEPQFDTHEYNSALSTHTSLRGDEIFDPSSGEIIGVAAAKSGAHSISEASASSFRVSIRNVVTDTSTIMTQEQNQDSVIYSQEGASIPHNVDGNDSKSQSELPSMFSQLQSYRPRIEENLSLFSDPRSLVSDVGDQQEEPMGWDLCGAFGEDMIDSQQSESRAAEWGEKTSSVTTTTTDVNSKEDATQNNDDHSSSEAYPEDNFGILCGDDDMDTVGASNTSNSR